jgi:hypothetical protein
MIEGLGMTSESVFNRDESIRRTGREDMRHTDEGGKDHPGA